MKLYGLFLLFVAASATPIPADTKLRASSASMSSTRAELTFPKNVQAKAEEQWVPREKASDRIVYG